MHDSETKVQINNIVITKYTNKNHSQRGTTVEQKKHSFEENQQIFETKAKTKYQNNVKVCVK